MSALLESFRARCQAAAASYATGQVDLISAVDALQDFAFTRGLVDEIGQDAVQAIMAAAFGPVRDEQPPSDEYEGLSSTFARACKLADAAIAERPVLEHIPIVAQHGVPSAEALQRIYERSLEHPAASTIAAAQLLIRLGDRRGSTHSSPTAARVRLRRYGTASKSSGPRDDHDPSGNGTGIRTTNRPRSPAADQRPIRQRLRATRLRARWSAAAPVPVFPDR
jgi:hypothetical protein